MTPIDLGGRAALATGSTTGVGDAVAATFDRADARGGVTRGGLGTVEAAVARTGWATGTGAGTAAARDARPHGAEAKLARLREGNGN